MIQDRGAKLLIIGMVVAALSGPLTAKTAKPTMKDGTSQTQPADPLAMIAKFLDAAIRDLEAGKTAPALAKMKEMRDYVSRVQKQTKTTFANKRCPIMGSPIDPDRVSAGLTREYKGQKVAFCCGGCPGQWDELSDAQKDAKLRKAQ